VLGRIVQEGDTRLQYIGCTGNFSARYAANQQTAKNNVRLHRFLRQYAVDHPDDFTFDYKILATYPQQRMYQAEKWERECAGLDAAWDALSYKSLSQCSTK